MLTPNQKVLAKIQTSAVVSTARRAHLPAPEARVMESLSEAIAAKRSEVEALVLAGKLGTEAYRQAKAQLSRWTDAWNSNR